MSGYDWRKSNDYHVHNSRENKASFSNQDDIFAFGDDVYDYDEDEIDIMIDDNRKPLVATFEKVTFEQFEKDCRGICGLGPDILSDQLLEFTYNNIKRPYRATEGSAGYDFKTPFGFKIAPGSSVLIPTGIRCFMIDGWFLQIVVRSSLGFKHNLMLANTLGIIDTDYYFAENEGHILLKLTYNVGPFNAPDNSAPVCDINPWERVAQGIFLPYGFALEYNEHPPDKRTGGFGSTGA